MSGGTMHIWRLCSASDGSGWLHPPCRRAQKLQRSRIKCCRLQRRPHPRETVPILLKNTRKLLDDDPLLRKRQSVVLVRRLTDRFWDGGGYRAARGWYAAPRHRARHGRTSQFPRRYDLQGYSLAESTKMRPPVLAPPGFPRRHPHLRLMDSNTAHLMDLNTALPTSLFSRTT
ncbi:uncharacterized protein SCHCODRAFT_02000336 [Schizophyllum commune H4-8]|uniref:uncharacterized protein n=1 Tax=Schizophyllum commune (strain H4-8 / FGSC 9210) TaxID=578458 RepID=UPI00215ED2AF|nr:uncharacterized protein SCHCODRAFT_02000336 [Schizophyllum commune H4-8]KAI5899000.1 hypothetical protein SCHCODRAFT_02000336 [Schizophyllum commune H4-8]